MTPKEKAKELVDKFANRLFDNTGTAVGAINIAEIAVDEIIKVVGEWEARTGHIDEIRYWEKVKQHLGM